MIPIMIIIIVHYRKVVNERPLKKKLPENLATPALAGYVNTFFALAKCGLRPATSHHKDVAFNGLTKTFGTKQVVRKYLTQLKVHLLLNLLEGSPELTSIGRSKRKLSQAESVKTRGHLATTKALP